MYEKIVFIALFVAGIVSSIFFYYKGRRNGTSRNNPSARELEQRAEADIAGARADNNTAADQNRELRENNASAEELIKRAKEILNMGNDN